MKPFFRLLLLVIVLNAIRYVFGWLVEYPLIFPHLSAIMEQHASYFNTEFTTLDWITSYFYNFMLWFTIVWSFHLLRPVLAGSDMVKSLKVFGIMWIFFASVSAIYMNHYSHSKAFYVWNITDALLAFTIVGLANGLLYPRIIK
jgi:hypothetical protein